MQHAGMQACRHAGAGGASMRYAQQHQPAASYRSICSSSAAAQQRRRQARACTHCQSLPTALCKLCVVLYRRIRPYCLSAAAAVSVCTAECMYTSVRFVIERVYVLCINTAVLRTVVQPQPLLAAMPGCRIYNTKEPCIIYNSSYPS
jgi:hypothetical protein